VFALFKRVFATTRPRFRNCGADELFSSLTNRSSIEEEDLEGSDDEVAALFDNNSVDVTELIRQAIVLQSPIQPLCSPDCPGLPEAEQYLGSVGDERFAALKNWQQKENNGTP
jgi:uncharacterized metal-binding protein YceD (DUF177 family)